MKCARAASLIPVVLMLSLTAGIPTASAQVPPSISVSPTSGTPGSAFTITFGGFYGCKLVRFTMGGVALGSGAGAEGAVTAVVPNLRPATYPIQAVGSPCELTAGSRFTIQPMPTTPPTLPPVTTVPPTTVPPVTTTRRPPVTTTTTRPGVTTTTTPPVTTTTEPPPTTTAATPSGEPGDGGLVFDKPAVQAGDPLSAKGTGCEPSSRVELSSGGEKVGAATADADGEFVTPVEFVRVEPGRHVVTATCGVVLTGSVDLILTSQTSGSTGTLVVLVFFLLASITLIARSRA